MFNVQPPLFVNFFVFLTYSPGSCTAWDSQTRAIAISCVFLLSETFWDPPKSPGSAQPFSNSVASYCAGEGCIRFYFGSGILPKPCKHLPLSVDILARLKRYIWKVFQAALAYGIWVLRSSRSKCKFEQAPLRASTLVVSLYLATCILLLILPW